MKPVKYSGGSQWAGYTFDQLAYERAVALARIEIEKDVTVMNFERVRQGNMTMSSGLFSRLLRTFSYADYLVLIVQFIRHVGPLFRKKK